MTAPFPPPPWVLRGEVVLVPPGILLARYSDEATMAYHELIVFSGVRRRGRFVGLDVAGIWVDSVASREGGRAIWGLPKELATFRWTSSRVSVADRDGAALCVAEIARAPVALPLPLVPAVFGRRGSRELWTASFGWMRGAPASVHVSAAASSVVSTLGLTGRRLAVAGGRLELPFPRPRVVS